MGPDFRALLANPVERHAERADPACKGKAFFGAVVHRFGEDETDAPQAVLHGDRISFNENEAGVGPLSKYLRQQEYVSAVAVADTPVSCGYGITKVLPRQRKC